MYAAKRLAACLVVAASCLAAVHTYRGSPRCRLGSERVHAPGRESQLLERRTRARAAVADQLLAGELNLVQAAARFRLLNDNPPEHRIALHSWPGRSDGERLCRQVIDWLYGHLQNRGLKPDEIEASLRPLRRELGMLLEQNDEIDLPPVD